MILHNYFSLLFWEADPILDLEFIIGVQKPLLYPVPLSAGLSIHGREPNLLPSRI